MNNRLVYSVIILLSTIPIFIVALRWASADGSALLSTSFDYELVSRFEKDFELDEEELDDSLRIDQEIKLGIEYQVSEDVLIGSEIGLTAENELYAEDDQEGSSEYNIELSELWLRSNSVAGSNFDLIVGRQNINEDREWWWDADLDAVVVHFDSDNKDLEFDIGIAEALARVDTSESFMDPEDDSVRRLFGQTVWQLSERHSVGVFGLIQRDGSSTPDINEIVSIQEEDEIDANLQWLGVRASGELPGALGGKLNYWLDSAVVNGKEVQFDFDDEDDRLTVDGRERVDVNGHALDLGLSWESPWKGSPVFTLGYAYGSGNRESAATRDGAFRQTGLEDNNGRLQGLGRFEYYGELFSPELSNIHIFTGGIGVPIGDDASIELVYHRYRQDEATDDVAGSGIDADPLGRFGDLGQELNLIVNYEHNNLEIEFAGSVFESGNAYGPRSGEKAFGAMLKFNYEFNWFGCEIQFALARLGRRTKSGRIANPPFSCRILVFQFGSKFIVERFSPRP